jgi:Zn-dependent M32 family carboxypeptidase
VAPAVKYCAPQQLSNFEQDSRGSMGAGSITRRRQAQETVMSEASELSEASEFRRYAEEALRWAEKSTTEKERLSLMELARTWSQAAYASEHPLPMGVNDSATDHGTAL